MVAALVALGPLGADRAAASGPVGTDTPTTGASAPARAAAEGQDAPPSDPGATTADAAHFHADWTHLVTPGAAISTSSPTVVGQGAGAQIVTGDNRGNLRSFDLTSGQPTPGWGSTSSRFGLRAPLSSDGTNVYVPVAQDGKDRVPRFESFDASGRRRWDSNPSTRLPTSGGFLLSGLSLATVDGSTRGFGGSSGHWVHALDANSGAERWAFRNADSTMATPALADLYGTGRPQVVTSNDATAEFPGDRHGGILRIMTAEGRQICSATQLVSGSTYASSGYNNSSPVVTEVDGHPLIAFGSTGPRQYGAGGNQIVAYDASCRARWASAPLAAQAAPSPALADVRGVGSIQVIALVGVRDGASTYPRVTVLDPRDGRVIDDTGTSLRPYGASLAYPPSTSVATADIDADGAQDLIVPARQGQFLVLDGRTLDVMSTIPTNLVVQNTPVVTATANGVRVTLAGYNASGSVVSSYVATGATLGERGWHTFAHDDQRTGRTGPSSGRDALLLEGDSLAPGESLRNPRTGWTASMQGDGNVVVRDASGAPRWWTGTSEAGSQLQLRSDGNLVVRAPDGSWSWQSGVGASGFERLELGDDGQLRVRSGSWVGSRRLNGERTVWPVPARRDRIGRNQSLHAGEQLRSTNGRYTVAMQFDGNLVLWDNGRRRWDSRTRDGSAEARVALGGDGNLVIYSTNGRVLKNFALAGRGGHVLAIGNDGVLKVLDRTGRDVWRHDRVVK